MYQEFRFKDEELLLLPEKAILWKKEKALLLADLHLGKVTHFRKAGIPLPAEQENINWEVLCQLIQEWNPQKIIILGDLFHSDYNHQWQNFCEITQIYSECQWILVKGNHDILEEQDYAASNMTLVKATLTMPPFILSHEPLEVESKYYNLCGHIHPGIRLVGQARQSLRLPIFYFGQQYGILPAFGAFTGLHVIQPEETDDLFIVASNEVINASNLFETNT